MNNKPASRPSTNPPPQVPTFGSKKALSPPSPPPLENWHEPCSKRMCCPYHVTMARFWFLLAFHHHPGRQLCLGKSFWRRHLLSISLKKLLTPSALRKKMELVIRYCTMHCSPSPVRYLSRFLYLRYTTTTTDYILILILHGSTCGGRRFLMNKVSRVRGRFWVGR